MQELQSITQWKSEYSIGIEEIDFQHKYFLKLINRLSIKAKEDLSAFLISRHVNEIIKYADFHFQSEENLMLLTEYPDFDEHYNLHKDLLDEIAVFLYGFNKGNKTFDELINFLMKWFIDHTIEQDQKFAKYYNNKT